MTEKREPDTFYLDIRPYDTVTILSGGKVLYSGPAVDLPIEFRKLIPAGPVHDSWEAS